MHQKKKLNHNTIFIYPIPITIPVTVFLVIRDGGKKSVINMEDPCISAVLLKTTACAEIDGTFIGR